MTISDSRSAFMLLKPNFNADAEEFWGIFLNHHLTLIDKKMIHRGTSHTCPIFPKDLFREAVRLNAHYIVVAHNHTSLKVTPSKQDKELTRRIQKIAILLDIPLIDHIIFTDTQYYSFRSAQIL